MEEISCRTTCDDPLEPATVIPAFWAESALLVIVIPTEVRLPATESTVPAVTELELTRRDEDVTELPTISSDPAD